MDKKKDLKKQRQEDRWDKRLRAILKEKGLSLRKAAEIAGVAPSVIDSWGGGAVPSDYRAVKRLADHLDISFTWLLTGEYEKTERKPTLTEIYDEVPYFDGLARIRIDRLIPRKGGGDET